MAEDLSRAKSLLREGRAPEAHADLLAATSLQGASAEAWYLRSLAEQQLKRWADGRESIAKALAIQPDQPFFHLQAGRLAEDAGDNEAAAAAFADAAGAKPDWPAAWASLGATRFALGQPDRAIEALTKAVTLDARLAPAWNNLGLALASLGRDAEASRAFQSALSADPRYGLARFNLARLAHQAGDVAAALAHAQEAARVDPRLVDAHLLAGDLHRKRGEDAKALACYRAAAAASPANPKGGNAAAELLWEGGALEEARTEFAAIALRHPGSLRAALGAELLLPQVYASAAHVDECRARYAEGLARLEADPARFAKPKPAETLQDIRWCNFYLAYQGRDDRDLQARYGDFVQAVLAKGAPAWTQAVPAPPRRKRLRVGFASHFFFDCTAGRYFSSWITELDPDRFEIHAYATNPAVDARTRALRAACAAWRHLPGRTVEEVAKVILDDELDVLVYPELGMHPDTFALAALRLAPVQCAGWGHPTTTGLATLDVFFSCEAMEPEGAEAHYRERLVRLPGLGTNYAFPDDAENASRRDLGLPEGRRLYLVPQSVFKIHPDNDALVADVLAADPEGAAVFFAAGPASLIDATVKRMKPALAARGLSPAKHLLFLPGMTHGAYLAVNRACDVMLDTLHWSGGNTSLDALASGLPVVTRPGTLMRGRQSLAMLRLLGLEDELVAKDAAHFTALATGIARDPERRRALSKRIEEARPRLFGDGNPVRAFAAALERIAAR